jgi:hypothetical protein
MMREQDGGEAMHDTRTWIRVLGVTSATFALVLFVLKSPSALRGETPATAVLGYLGFVVIPAFAVPFLCVFARLWWAFGISVWLLLPSVIFCLNEFTASYRVKSPTPIFLFLAVATVCVTPFLHRAEVARKKFHTGGGVGSPTDVHPGTPPSDTELK